MSMKRLNESARREDILKAVVDLANKKQGDYRTATRGEIARMAKCSPALVTHYFGGMDMVRKAAIKYAMRIKNVRVIAQALMYGDLKKNNCILQLDVETREKLKKLNSL